MQFHDWRTSLKFRQGANSLKSIEFSPGAKMPASFAGC
jgi:hypothetical protein